MFFADKAPENGDRRLSLPYVGHVRVVLGVAITCKFPVEILLKAPVHRGEWVAAVLCLLVHGRRFALLLDQPSIVCL